jgi:muramoyltetrapeptide carboxypeptidase
MKIQPPFLKPGDEVAVISPAYAIDGRKINDAVQVFESWGLRVRVGKNALKREGPFAGSVGERLADFQEMTSDSRIKAVICSRGGYGMLKIIGQVDFSPLKRHPRWYVGFSDITILHTWLAEVHNIVSIHGEMPLNYAHGQKSGETMQSLYEALFEGIRPVRWEGEFFRPGIVKGELTGGNLSLLYSLIGTIAEPGTRGRILFIEDTGEYYYHLDRMMTSLKMAGKLAGLSALVTGGFTEMKETDPPWGKSSVQIISDIVSGYKYPVLTGFPAGHINDNRAFYVGKKAKITIKGETAILSYFR